jgi:hypothetical protein
LVPVARFLVLVRLRGAPRKLNRLWVVMVVMICHTTEKKNGRPRGCARNQRGEVLGEVPGEVPGEVLGEVLGVFLVFSSPDPRRVSGAQNACSRCPRL